MQKQINLAQKMSAQDQSKPHVNNVESLNSPFNHWDQSIDFDEEIETF